jgi:hypothetical protein
VSFTGSPDVRDVHLFADTRDELIEPVAELWNASELKHREEGRRGQTINNDFSRRLLSSALRISSADSPQVPEGPAYLRRHSMTPQVSTSALARSCCSPADASWAYIRMFVWTKILSLTERIVRLRRRRLQVQAFTQPGERAAARAWSKAFRTMASNRLGQKGTDRPTYSADIPLLRPDLSAFAVAFV